MPVFFLFGLVSLCLIIKGGLVIIAKAALGEVDILEHRT